MSHPKSTGSGLAEFQSHDDETSVKDPRDERIAELEDVLEKLLIAIGMGWDVDGAIEAARAVLPVKDEPAISEVPSPA
jgi:hypothetical protein